ncbi:MAG: hypothetical protein SWX82_27400 [Cyanobacteriota bacterium]|nr:hypothetical protein [Cyanobacteriota bacterium]
MKGEERLVNFDNLPENKSARWHFHSWYLHGEFIDKSAPQNSQTIFTEKNFKSLPSLEEIDLELTNMANKYRWVFLPWGSKSDFLLSFGFLSKNHVLRDKFINSYSSLFGKNSIISSYDYVSNLSELIKGILVGEYDEPAHQLWEVGNCDENSLWMITELQLDEDFSVFPWWEPSSLKWIKSLTLSRKYPFPLQVYQIYSKKTFLSICWLDTQQPDTLIFVPSNTDFNSLVELLNKTEDYDNNYSDLIYIQDILKTIPWFFGIARDQSDLGISLFVSQDNSLLQKFDALNRSQNQNYSLLSCF